MLSPCLQRQVRHRGQAVWDSCKHRLVQAHLCLVPGAVSSCSVTPHRPWRASLGDEVQISMALHSVQMAAIQHTLTPVTSLSGPVCVAPPAAAMVGLAGACPAMILKPTHKVHLLS